MAHCFVKYFGEPVYVNEDGLIMAMSVLWSEASAAVAADQGKSHEIQSHLNELRHEADYSGGGCLQLGLEEMLKREPEKEDDFLEYIDLAEAKLTSFGEFVPGKYLEHVVEIKGYNYQDLSPALMVEILEILRKLLLDKKKER